MIGSNNSLLQALLGFVVAASLLLLLFGLDEQPGIVAVLQLPTTFAQVLFVLAVLARLGVTETIGCLTRLQRGLILALAIYVIAVTAAMGEASAVLIAPSWVVHIVFFAAAVAFFCQSGADRDQRIWLVFGITGLLHVAAFCAAWIIWPDAIRMRVLPVFDNIRHLGYFLAPAAAAMAVIYATRRDQSVIAFLCYAAAAFYIIYTGSRGGGVALLAGLGVICAYGLWHRQAVLASRVLVLLVVTGALILISEYIPQLPWKPLFGRGVEAVDQTGTQMLNGRSQVWQSAWQTIQQNWLWGYGPAIMGRLPEYQGLIYRHPHNIGLQLLLHWGVAGSFVILATIFAFVPNLWAAMRRAPQKALVPLAVLATMCIHSLVDGSLYYPYSAAIAIIAFAQLQGIGWHTRQQEAGHSA